MGFNPGKSNGVGIEGTGLPPRRDPPTADERNFRLRRDLWRREGVAAVRPEDVNDPWERQILVNLASRLYGRRAE